MYIVSYPIKECLSMIVYLVVFTKLWTKFIMSQNSLVMQYILGSSDAIVSMNGIITMHAINSCGCSVTPGAISAILDVV